MVAPERSKLKCRTEKRLNVRRFFPVVLSISAFFIFPGISLGLSEGFMLEFLQKLYQKLLWEFIHELFCEILKSIPVKVASGNFIGDFFFQKFHWILTKENSFSIFLICSSSVIPWVPLGILAGIPQGFLWILAGILPGITSGILPEICMRILKRDGLRIYAGVLPIIPPRAPSTKVPLLFFSRNREILLENPSILDF